MGQAQVPYALATNEYVPGSLLTDQAVLSGTGQNSMAGPLALAQGATGTKAWLYNTLEPANAKMSSIGGRQEATAASAALATGTVYAWLMPGEAGLSVANMTLVSLTAEATGTHAWCGLADNTGKVLAISADQTGAAYFAANAAITTAFAASFTTTYTGYYYGFVCVVASGTMPTFAAAPAMIHAAVSTIPPIVCGTALTGQTVPVAVGSSLGTITPTAGHQIYTYLT